GFSYVTKQCWNYAEAHEIFHNLGAVADAAPNATGGAHCVDMHDIMCYDDGVPNGKKRKTVCEDKAWERLLDCGGNDYFNTGKLAKGSFLENHWNTANSRFLGPINGSEPQTEKIRVSLHAPVY